MSGPFDPAADRDHAAKMIGTLRCLAECDGYEAEAKARGIAPHEVELLAGRRVALIRKRRGPGGLG